MINIWYMLEQLTNEVDPLDLLQTALLLISKKERIEILKRLADAYDIELEED